MCWYIVPYSACEMLDSEAFCVDCYPQRLAELDSMLFCYDCKKILKADEEYELSGCYYCGTCLQFRRFKDYINRPEDPDKMWALFE